MNIYWLKWALSEHEASELQTLGWTFESASEYSILLRSPPGVAIEREQSGNEKAGEFVVPNLPRQSTN